MSSLAEICNAESARQTTTRGILPIVLHTQNPRWLNFSLYTVISAGGHRRYDPQLRIAF
ncbi:hypothetical protein C8R44DRAFT_811927 [Mycena epipterygia]|nr:hypothetical protein C8R44DRAFT_811927 [Mycena epipterygia]